MVRTRDRTTYDLTSIRHATVMEAIRDAGIDKLLAPCGSYSCANGHVYVDQAPSDQLELMSEEESELLDSSSFRQPTSRLSCQVQLTAALGELSVEIAPER